MVYYAPTFDAFDHGFLMTLTRAAYDPIVIDATALSNAETALGGAVNARRFVHLYDLGPATSPAGGTPFAHGYATRALSAVLGKAIADGMTAQSWGGTIGVAFGPAFDLEAYAIEAGASPFNFGITFGNAWTRALLGFAGNSAAAASHAGSRHVTHFLESTHARSMDVEDVFESQGIASLMIGDDATTFAGTARSHAAKMRHWTQTFEPKSRVVKRSASTSRPYTYESLFEDCRTVLPFVVDDGADKMVCMFTDAGSAFRGKTRPGGIDDDVHFNVPFDVWLAAYLDGGG